MNGMFWDQVICNAKIEETTEKGAKTFTRCEGIMLPLKRGTGQVYNEVSKTTQYFGDSEIWKCSNPECGREVK